MDVEKELLALREAIRHERKRQHISQEQLAELVDVSPTHIKHIEGGHRLPSVGCLFEIAKILNLSLDAVVFPGSTSKDSMMRKRIDIILDSSDERELSYFLSLLELFNSYKTM